MSVTVGNYVDTTVMAHSHLRVNRTFRHNRQAVCFHASVYAASTLCRVWLRHSLETNL